MVGTYISTVDPEIEDQGLVDQGTHFCFSSTFTTEDPDILILSEACLEHVTYQNKCSQTYSPSMTHDDQL